MSENPTSSRLYFALGAGAVVVVLVVIVLAVSGVFSGEDEESGSQAAVPTVTVTPTELPPPTETPPPPATDVPPTATATAAPPATEPPAATAEPTPIPAGTSNDVWTPVREEQDDQAMVLVPAGCFIMGTDDGESDEGPAHEICVEAFWLDATEVTRGMYAACVEAGACSDTVPPEGYFADDQPVSNVTWFQAVGYCEWRDARLPTEAEWEYAARGPEGLDYPWGSVFVEDNAVYRPTSGSQPAPVGSRPAGASWVGALDMSGNLWEWTSSLKRDYPYQPDDGREDMGDTTTQRALRGGSYLSPRAASVRAVVRDRFYPDRSEATYGFRCARAAD